MLLRARTSSAHAVRRVKNGTVKIGGMVFYPVEFFEERDGFLPVRPYRGELDGVLCYFNRYADFFSGATERFLPIISLQDSYENALENYRNQLHRLPMNDLKRNLFMDLECHGVLVFYWWYTEEFWQEMKRIRLEMAAGTKCHGFED